MTITGGPLTASAVNSYKDHRIAMALAVAGLAADGETIIRTPNASPSPIRASSGTSTSSAPDSAASDPDSSGASFFRNFFLPGFPSSGSALPCDRIVPGEDLLRNDGIAGIPLFPFSAKERNVFPFPFRELPALFPHSGSAVERTVAERGRLSGTFCSFPSSISNRIPSRVSRMPGVRAGDLPLRIPRIAPLSQKSDKCFTFL